MRHIVRVLNRRHSVWRTYLALTGLGLVFLAIVGFLSTATELLGIPGSGVSLIVVVAAVLAGPLVGVAVAASLTVAFYAWVSDFGAVGSLFGVLLGLVIWVLAAVLSGVVADAMRMATSDREASDEQRRLYETLEAGLLPGKVIDIPGLKVMTRYIPSERRMRLGGDFLDVRRTSESGLAFILGDVAGHGPQAAALSATLRASWQGLLLSGAPPSLIVHALNDVVNDGGEGDGPFVTACLAWLDLDERRLTYLSAGHEPMLLMNDSVVPLSIGTLPLGVEPEVELRFVEVELEPPCTLFAYTDGLLEDRLRRHAPLGGERWLIDQLAGLGRSGLGDVELDRLVETGLSGRMSDDVAVLALAISEVAVRSDKDDLTTNARVARRGR